MRNDAQEHREHRAMELPTLPRSSAAGSECDGVYVASMDLMCEVTQTGGDAVLYNLTVSLPRSREPSLHAHRRHSAIQRLVGPVALFQAFGRAGEGPTRCRAGPCWTT